jgi:serpin B
MAFAGAKGATAAQIRTALRLEASDEAVHAASGEMIRRLNSPAGGKYELTVANALWIQNGTTIESEFLDLTSQHYGGGVEFVDFERAEAARDRINGWVLDKTNKKILGLVPPGGLGSDTRLALTNAVYFKGTWARQFDEADTTDNPFYLESGDQVPAPLMFQVARFYHVQADGFQAVDLDYRGTDLSMIVLLPDERNGLRDLETRLSTRMLHDCVESMSERRIELFLPRFRTTPAPFDVGAQLRDLGMTLVFSRSQADFSGIDGQGPCGETSLFLATALHKALVDVNEEGAEAAAATFVRMVLGVSDKPPPPVPVFRADHPFVFGIRDRKSGALLFLGRLVDPTLAR